MNRETPQHGPTRDAGARLYEDMPSVTDRGQLASGRDDSFGAPDIGGPYEPRYGRDLRQAEGRAIADSTHRAMQPRRRGTRNATRPDSLIAEEISERFRDDELLDASEILLRVEDGRVLLTGEVPERWMKHRAEDIADGVRGVSEVENRIHVDNGLASFGPGGAVRSGLDQPGSGFSSSPPNADWQPRDSRVD
ncbi:BON domain-containing protein [Cognatilysobacter segetis]|uniref:BON domain-containing protein n=1 Tax=Cognatilysobacter segetis TaxID=2492394 RepID=UPI00105D0880|nr:BON domain-containing protein [Lysobacter segetis]